MPMRGLRTALGDDAGSAGWRGDRRARHRACRRCSLASCSRNRARRRMHSPPAGMVKSVGDDDRRRGRPRRRSTAVDSMLSLAHI